MAPGTRKAASLWPEARLRALCGPWTSEDQRSGRCAGACGPTDREAERHLHRCGLLGTKDDDLDLSGEGDPESNLASSAVSGQSPPAGPQYPEGRLRAGRVIFDRSGCARSPTTSRSVHRSMGSRCTRPPARAGLTPRAARRCCAMSCVRRSRKSEWSSNPMASWPEARLRAAHHPEKGLRLWDGRG